MNKSPIEWCDYTANPVRGKCALDCHYCYVSAQRRRFKTSEEVTFYPEVLDAIHALKKSATVFVGSSHDLFGWWVNAEWLGKTLTTCAMTPQHEYVFLTKNPERYAYWDKPNTNVVVKKFTRYFGSSIDTVARAEATNPFMGNLDFLSIEPLLEDVAHHINWMTVKAIIIGAQTGKGAIRPEKEWVENLIEQADHFGVKVFIKDNLLKLYPELPRRRELLWPLFMKEKK